MRIRTFLLLLGVPLLLMGALIVGLQIGEDELERSVAPTPTEPRRSTRRERRRANRRRAEYGSSASAPSATRST